MNALAYEIFDTPQTKIATQSENLVRLANVIKRYYPNLLCSVHLLFRVRSDA